MAAVIGIIVGLLSTYPIALGVVPSFIFWGIAGILLGVFSKGAKGIMWPGIVYGVFLSVSFLYSRFGGTVDHLLGYTLFVAAASVCGALGGVCMVWIGSKFYKI